MLRYTDAKVVMAEVPDEITLAINISNCPCHCRGCHSPYLADDIGSPLVYSTIYKGDRCLVTSPITNLIKSNEGITCVCLMGGDSEPFEVNLCAEYIHEEGLKTAWYSGRQELSRDIDLSNFDYIKLGPYIEELGPLTSRTTNQRFYRVESEGNINNLIDITNRFWK